MFMFQMHGFTCGVDDLLITLKKDEQRKNQLEGCEKMGKEIHVKALQVEDDADAKKDNKIVDVSTVGMLFDSIVDIVL